MNLRDDLAYIHHFTNPGNENQKEEVTWERVHSYSGPLSTFFKKPGLQTNRTALLKSTFWYLPKQSSPLFSRLGKSFKTGRTVKPLHFTQVTEGNSHVALD